MSDSLSQAIAQAQQAAANVAPTAPANLPSNVAPQYASTAVAFPGGGVPMKLSNEDLMNSSLGVQGYIKVNEHGLTFGKDGGLVLEPVDTVVDLSAVVNNRSIKSNTTPARYEKTFDGIMATSGKPWRQAVAEIQALTPTAREYPSADIAFQVIGDVSIPKGGVQAEDGTRWGYGLSTTNRDNWANLLRAVAAAGLDVNTARIRVRIGSEKKTGNGNTWGVMTFEFLGNAE